MPISLSHLLPANSNASAQIDKQFKKVISPIALGKMASKCGLKQRQSHFNPSAYMQALLVCSGSNEQYNFATINKQYGITSKHPMHDKPFHNRLRSPESREFIESAFKRIYSFVNSISASPTRGKNLLNALRNKGLDIDDIVCIDGSYWHVKGELEHIFPGSRAHVKADNSADGSLVPYGSKKSQNAQIGIQTVYSPVSNFVKEVTITSGTANEKDYVSIPENERLLYTLDAGYVKYSMLKEMDDKGHYFMIRGKRNMDGEIIDCHLNGVKEQSFIGLRLKDRLVGSYMKMDDMTLTVRLNNGLTVRVLRVWSRSKSDISFLITNIKNTTFTARELAAIQKIRWQVELFFKALKSGVNLRGIKTKIVDIIYSLIYVSFIVAMLKYLIFLAVDTGLQKGGKTMQSASFYKIFVSSMTYWTSYIKSLFSKGITKLQELLKSFLKLTHLYKMSPQSRKKQENLNTADSVIKMWEEGAYASAFDAQFTVC